MGHNLKVPGTFRLRSVRTLVISDLHLGMRLRRDVLRTDAGLEGLLAALDDVDRLVLLGDVIEGLEGRPRVAMRLAEPVLRVIGETIGREREIVLLPGNHDHLFIRPWLRARRAARRQLGLATRVPISSSPALAELCAWLRPARVQVRYPGVWLADGVYATHGHYLDRHLVPESSTGMRRFLGAVPQKGARAWDYEQSAGMSAAAVQGLLATTLPKLVGEPIDRAAGLARRAGLNLLPVAAALVGESTVAPVTAGALGVQFRRAALPAMAEVLMRLHVRAQHVIFGHVHRAGPRFDDDPAEWAPGDGTRHLVNSGSWVYEPLLLAGAAPPHPYWPGGAVVLEDDAPPRAVGLLDGVAATDLRA
jgi:hypothetical protein